MCVWLGHWPLFVCAHVSSAECKCKWILCNNFHMNFSPKRKKESQAKAKAERRRISMFISAYWWILWRWKWKFDIFHLLSIKMEQNTLNAISVNHQIREYITLSFSVCVTIRSNSVQRLFSLDCQSRWDEMMWCYLCVFVFGLHLKIEIRNKIVHDKLHTPEILHEIHCPWNWLDFAQCKL